MRPEKRTLDATGTSTPIMLNYEQANFKVGLQVEVTGTATYTVHSTSDDPADFADSADYIANAVWFDVTDLASLSASAQGNLQFPVRAVYLSATITAGEVILTLLQGV